MIEVFEDPATGSACCALAAYLALQMSKGSVKKDGYQFELIQGVEMGQRSVIGVHVTLDPSSGQVIGVKLSGSAVQVMEGLLTIPS